MYWRCLYPEYTMKVSQLLLDVRDEQDIRDSTFKCWLKAAKPLADVEVSDIDRRTVTRYWQSQLKPIGTLSPETLRRRLSLLTGIWNMGIEEEIINVPNYWSRASRKIKLNTDYSRLGKEYPVRPFSFYGRYQTDPIFLAIWFHGFRIGEIAGLLPNDIRFDNQIPYFRIRNNSVRNVKPGAQRELPIHPEFYAHVNPLTTDYSQYPGKNWSQMFSERLELPRGEAAHSLRHNFITRCRSAELQDSMISKLVGHKINGMTARYGTWTLENKLKAIRQVRQ